jgi:hypothetical protein
MLTYLGTQRTVKNVGGSIANTYKYATGPNVFPSPGSVAQAALGAGVVGSFSTASYDSTRCYFLSRGATQVYTDTMTGLAIDIANMLGITPAALLVASEVNGKTTLNSSSYIAFNILRDPSNQVGTATSVSNKNSLQANQIRS